MWRVRANTLFTAQSYTGVMQLDAKYGGSMIWTDNLKRRVNGKNSSYVAYTESFTL